MRLSRLCALRLRWASSHTALVLCSKNAVERRFTGRSLEPPSTPESDTPHPTLKSERTHATGGSADKSSDRHRDRERSENDRDAQSDAMGRRPGQHRPPRRCRRNVAQLRGLRLDALGLHELDESAAFAGRDVLVNGESDAVVRVDDDPGAGTAAGAPPRPSAKVGLIHGARPSWFGARHLSARVPPSGSSVAGRDRDCFEDTVALPTRRGGPPCVVGPGAPRRF